MKLERAVDIDAPAARVWDVLTDISAWPRRVDTVEVAELVTRPPLEKGARIRLKQTKMPVGTWDVTAWSAPTYFELRQDSRGITTVVGHRVDDLGDGRSRLTLRLEMRGPLSPLVALVSRGATARYLAGEAHDMKLACESPGP